MPRKTKSYKRNSKTTFKKSSGKRKPKITKRKSSSKRKSSKKTRKGGGKIPHFVVDGESWNNRDLEKMKLNSKNNNKIEQNHVGYGYAHIGPDYEGCIYGDKDPSYTDNKGKKRKYVENVECGNIADKDPNESFSKEKGDICWCPIDENNDMTDLMFN